MAYDDYYDDDERGNFFGALLMMLIGGIIATIAFDAYGQYYSQVFGYPELAPISQASDTLTKLLGPELEPISGVLAGWNNASIAQLAHFVAGVVACPLGYVLLARPIARTIIPSIPWWVLGAIYGAVIWAFSHYVIAHLVLGSPAFLIGGNGLPPGELSAIAGHIVYGLVLAAVLRRFGRA